MSSNTVKTVIALVIGLASITAGVFTWRASQINSTAAFDDRSSVGQTITGAQRRIDVTVDASAQAAAYDAYVAAFDLADRVDDDQSDDIRTSATAEAVAAGVFPSFAVSEPTAFDPTPFDVDARIASLAAAQETGFASGGPLDPDRFAEEADRIRDRVRALQVWALIVLVAIGALTIAEVSDTRRWRRGAGTLGALIYTVAALGALTRDFYA